jgi:hypothetical protein
MRAQWQPWANTYYCFGLPCGGLFFNPIVDHHAPEGPAIRRRVAERDVAIATGDQKTGERFAAGQGNKVFFDDGLRRSAVNSIRILPTIWTLRAPLSKIRSPIGRTLRPDPNTGRARPLHPPIGTAQRRLVGPINAAAIAVDAIADRLSVEQLGNLLLGMVISEPTQLRLDPRSAHRRTHLTTATISCAVEQPTKVHM